MKKVLSVTLALAIALVCLGSTVFAAPYKPSPEQYAGPTPVDGVDEEYVLTPYGERYTKNTQYPEIRKMLEAAMADIKAASTWEDLCGGSESQMDNMKAKATDPAAKACTIEDLVLEYLFDYSHVDGSDDVIDGSRQFTVATSLKKGDVFVVLHDVDYINHNWVVVSDSEYSLADNGDLTIKVSSLSPFAVIRYTTTRQNTDRISPRTEGEEDVLIAPAPEQKSGFQFNFGSISGFVMVAFGICMLAYAFISTKNKRK